MKTTNAGFTLIESLITLLVFSIIMVVMVGAFVSYLVVQRRAFNVQQVQENASYLLEAMTKEIRVAKLLSSETADCVNAPATSLNFTDQEGQAVTYDLVGSDLRKTEAGTSLVVNSNAIQFTSLRFCVKGVNVNDDRQPRITIFASLQSTNAIQRAKLDIQTTVSQRFLSD